MIHPRTVSLIFYYFQKRRGACTFLQIESSSQGDDFWLHFAGNKAVIPRNDIEKAL